MVVRCFVLPSNEGEEPAGPLRIWNLVKGWPQLYSTVNESSNGTLEDSVMVEAVIRSTRTFSFMVHGERSAT